MNIKSFMLEPWMPIHEIFANTACVALQWWLRTKHNIIVWVEPVPDKKYASYYGKEDESWHSGSTDTNPTYENMFITALKAALNSLPPAAQEHN
jgi:hypothetical protein